MAIIYEIIFKGERRETFSNPKLFHINVGDWIIVQADRGENIGRVAVMFDSSIHKKDVETKGDILRKASEEDLNLLKENRDKETEAFRVCRQKIIEHGVNMKLIDVEYQHDSNKITFFFTADKRIDFRALVRDLASIYRTRIELRQIGVRDEARRLGGIGVCGRSLCCNTFIDEFEPITSQMARDQHLSLSPTKISGLCGRLMCCLAYEEEFYREISERLPKNGIIYFWKGQNWEVINSDIFTSSVILRNENGDDEKVSLSILETLEKGSKLKDKAEKPEYDDEL